MNQELRQRVRARNGEAHQNREKGDDATAALDNNHDAAAPPPPHASARPQTWINYFSIALHVFAIAMVIYGFVLRISFHSGVECEMTYSMRHFVLLHNNVPTHPIYKLFKFTDLRDPRQTHLHPRNNDRYKEWSATSSREWCTIPKNATTTIVLYIPGHWGSFSQARSLGAHGLTWTRQREDVSRISRLLLNGKWNGLSQNLSSFVYDVYAIDFAEQGGALHVNFLYAQCHYVAQVIMTLVRQCGNHNIILVGHSMGGLVARAVPLLHPETQSHVQHLVTLATPHDRLPFAFDESLHRFYELLDEEDNPLTTISISGGMRDEMMPPKVCRLESGNNNTMSLLASEIVTSTSSSQGGLGMDHRAIVWCHNVLERVRQFLHVMAIHHEDPGEQRRQLESLLPSRDYSDELVAERDTFLHQFGFFKSIAMESAMLYRAELVLGLYTLASGIYHTVPKISVAMVPFIVIALAWLLSEPNNILVVLILSLVANAIHWLVSFGLAWLVSQYTAQRKSTAYAKQHAVLFAVIFVLVQVCVALFGCFRNRHSVANLPLLSAVVVTTIVFLPMVSLSLLANFSAESSNLSLLSLFLPIWPFLVVGKLFMIAWSIVQGFSGTDTTTVDLVRFLVLVCLPVYLRILPLCPMSRHSRMPLWILPCGYALMILALAPRMLQVGGGYVVARFLSCIAWIDVLVGAATVLLAGK